MITTVAIVYVPNEADKSRVRNEEPKWEGKYGEESMNTNRIVILARFLRFAIVWIVPLLLVM